jgi:hypothetical protein
VFFKKKNYKKERNAPVSCHFQQLQVQWSKLCQKPPYYYIRFMSIIDPLWPCKMVAESNQKNSNPLITSWSNQLYLWIAEKPPEQQIER